jgi:tetratricopeptide (TPR) repeat protein
MADQRQLCPEAELKAVIAAFSAAPSSAMPGLDRLLSAYPGDPRLLFLKGSMLAAGQDYAGAIALLRRAVDAAPDYAIARFQLGMLLLTSGKPYDAQEAWGPLHGLPPAVYLRRFVDGMCHLIRDEFEPCVHALQEGIAANTENEPLNRDMQLVIDEVRSRQSGSGPVSAVDMLLQQAALKSTRH